MKNLSALLAALAALACFAPRASAQPFVITNLGALSGLPFTNPNSINNLGQVAGSSFSADFSVGHPFRTAPNSPINPATDDLGLLPGAASGSGASINDLGQVAGTARIPLPGNPGFFSTIAFRADPGNPVLVNLGTRVIDFLGINSSNANGINNLGQVTGAASTAEAIDACLHEVESQAYRTTPNGLVPGSDALGTTQTGNCGFSQAFAINGSGQVVGFNNKGGFFGPPIHAFLATPGMINQDLGTLGNFFLTSMAFSINDSAQVVGNSGVATGGTHAFLVNPGSPMQDLGTLGGSNSSATSINNAGVIVGNSLVAGDSAVHAFIYQNGAMTDLNSRIPANSGWILENATSINTLGQIVGTGTFNGSFSGYRLDPGGAAGVNILLSEISNPALALTAGEVNALSAKLNAALASLGRDNNHSASGQLGAFINQVQALVNSGRLSASDAAGLIAEANNILAGL